MTRFTTLLLVMMFVAPAAWATVPISLEGSPASMLRQNDVARLAGYTFVNTLEDIDRLVEAGAFVPLTGNEHYALRDGLSSNVARPEMRLFVERLAAEYFSATGEQLVVTSLTRPTSMQPPNASARSVHPAGIAVDFRISQQEASRQWLENRLLEMEQEGVLDVTREHHPPHYHVALFTERYRNHVEWEIGPEALAAELGWNTAEEPLELDEVAPAAVLTMISPDAESDARRSIWSRIRAFLFG